jgi:hypothetical protein
MAAGRKRVSHTGVERDPLRRVAQTLFVLLDISFRKTHMPRRGGGEGARLRGRHGATVRAMVAASLGIAMAGGGVYAATNWVVGVASASSGQARSASTSNLIISATASPAANNLLYPGGTGDVVVTIANPNPYPVTITAVELPSSTTYATGYTTNALATFEPGCLASTPSTVTWSFETAVSGSSHALTTPLTVAASGAPDNPLAVTLTNDATMGASAPPACASAYFSMPSFTGITATGGSAVSTTTPATDGWSS